MNDLKNRIIQAVRNTVELPKDLIENIENIEQIKTYCLCKFDLEVIDLEIKRSYVNIDEYRWTNYI